MQQGRLEANGADGVSALAVLVYLAGVAASLCVGMWNIDWRLVYPLDDTYIHLAVARTLAEHGVWSAMLTEPSSPSSSVLWTLVLAGVGRLGWLSEWTPIVVNTVLGVVAVLVGDRIMRVRAPRLSRGQRFGLLAGLIFAASLTVQTLVGMEHTLQILAALCFVEAGLGTALERTSEGAHALAPGLIWIFAPMLVAVRFEASFLVLPVCLLLFWYRRVFESVALGLVSMFPVGAFAAYSWHIGNYPLPNSILLKTNAVGIKKDADMGLNVLINLWNSAFLNIVVLLVSMMLVSGLLKSVVERRPLSATDAAAVVVGLGTVLQLVLAATGWLYRYEAYLVGVAIVFLGPYALLALRDHKGAERIEALMLRGSALLVLGVVLLRVFVSHFDTVRSMEDRYLEHLLPVEFVSEYFPRAPIMINDLGLHAWHHRGEVFDMFGLGSNKPIELRLSSSGYTSTDIARWAEREGVVLAIHQVQWPFVFGHLPGEWELVAVWQTPRNVVFGDRLVGFFAPDEQTRRSVHRHLRAFVEERVPASVKTKFYEPGEKTFEEFVRESMPEGMYLREQ